MSLARPLLSSILDPKQLLVLLGGFYDRLTELSRSSGSVVTQTLATGDNRVVHGLPAISEWTVVDKSANADVWKSATVNSDPRVIILAASAPVSVKLRFA